ncbi:hypothetical protein FACS189434_07740 [Bacteroidia bacterium]|nr:hypothetical protein FACS189434_07740 [Bacteroidia bacterium]
MKKTIYFLAMLFAVTMTSCSKEKDEPQVKEPEPEPVENFDGLSYIANPNTYLNKKIQIDVDYGSIQLTDLSKIYIFTHYTKENGIYVLSTDDMEFFIYLYRDYRDYIIVRRQDSSGNYNFQSRRMYLENGVFRNSFDIGDSNSMVSLTILE